MRNVTLPWAEDEMIVAGIGGKKFFLTYDLPKSKGEIEYVHIPGRGSMHRNDLWKVFSSVVMPSRVRMYCPEW
ncbi:MAG: hypothetical protein L0Y56_06665 [Nitrospira sp.]|nr:hypothetical protein [Nitrospira sp.]